MIITTSASFKEEMLVELVLNRITIYQQADGCVFEAIEFGRATA